MSLGEPHGVQQHLGGGNPHYQYKLGNARVEYSPDVCGHGSTRGWQLDTSQQCAPQPRKPAFKTRLDGALSTSWSCGHPWELD